MTDHVPVTYRPLRGADREALADIVCRTWEFGRCEGLQTARRLSRSYLAECLSGKTYALVAETAGHPCGVIVGRTIPVRVTVRERFRYRWSRALLQMTAEGRAALDYLEAFDRADRELLVASPNCYQAELSLFIVDAAERGRRIGGRLYEGFTAYMSAAGLSRFFLFTDTDCSFAFYDRHGLVRRGVRNLEIQLGEGQVEHLAMFLYDGSVQ